MCCPTSSIRQGVDFKKWLYFHPKLSQMHWAIALCTVMSIISFMGIYGDGALSATHLLWGGGQWVKGMKAALVPSALSWHTRE